MTDALLPEICDLIEYKADLVFARVHEEHRKMDALAEFDEEDPVDLGDCRFCGVPDSKCEEYEDQDPCCDGCNYHADAHPCAPEDDLDDELTQDVVVTAPYLIAA